MNNLGCCLFYEFSHSPFSRVLSGYVPGSRYSGQEAYGALAAFVDFMGKMSYNRVQISAFMKGF